METGDTTDRWRHGAAVMSMGWKIWIVISAFAIVAFGKVIMTQQRDLELQRSINDTSHEIECDRKARLEREKHLRSSVG
jgi:hypothetical protein